MNTTNEARCYACGKHIADAIWIDSKAYHTECAPTPTPPPAERAADPTLRSDTEVWFPGRAAVEDHDCPIEAAMNVGQTCAICEAADLLRRWLTAHPAASSESVETAERIVGAWIEQEQACGFRVQGFTKPLIDAIAAALTAERRAREALEDAVLDWDKHEQCSQCQKALHAHAARIRAARAGDGGGEGE